MPTKVSATRAFSAFLIIMIILASAGSVYAASTLLISTAGINNTPSLMQFYSSGHILGFSSQGVYVAAGSHALHMDFIGANPTQPQAASIIRAGTNEKGTYLNQVTYKNLWDGVSLTYAATAAGIYTTTYTLSPGADVKNIRLGYNLPLALNRNGFLNIAFDTGTMTESAPLAWQDIRGRRVPVDVSFLVHDREVGFGI
jgi:hypothetical protein